MDSLGQVASVELVVGLVFLVILVTPAILESLATLAYLVTVGSLELPGIQVGRA